MTDLKSWAELFPEGRQIYYEGDDPQAFADEIKTKFGFDPSENNPLWKYGFSFHCPAHLL
jgi:hypothetical protein